MVPSYNTIFSEFVSKTKGVSNSKDGLIYKNKRLTWELAKETREILPNFNAFRKKIVDNILFSVMESLKCAPDCDLSIGGSTDLTSDYDITISGKNSHCVVDRFNDIFISLFKKRSDLIFDTNVYGASFFHASVSTNYDFVIKNPSKPCSPANFIFYIDTNGDPRDTRNQRVWAYIKFFVHLNNSPFKKEAIKMLKTIPNFKALKKEVDKKINTLDASKSTYEKELRKYNCIKNDFEASKSKNIEKAVELKEQSSKTNYFGKETYFTQGAINHVVGKIQLKFSKLVITENEYIDSMIENLGDIVKELNHHPDDNKLFLTKASKYIIRVFLALSAISNLELSKIIKSAKNLRKLRGSENDEDINKEIKKFKELIGCNENTNLKIVECIFKESFLRLNLEKPL